MSSTSITNQDHKVAHHTQNERCNAPYELCSDKSCKLYKKHMICSEHPFHPGDRIVNWEMRNKFGYVYYTKPNIVSLNQVIYIKYDNDNNKIHARFGKCACGDIFLCHDCPRDISKAMITNKYRQMFGIDHVVLKQ